MKNGRKYCIASPNYDFGHADVSKIQIGALGLSLEQKFLFVYDYGDEWTFLVEIDVITDANKESVVPYAVESQGDAPQQYDDFY